MFSIVTVVYNAAETIERTINSVLNQRFKNFEYLIIDSESTDGTTELIRKYVKQDPRIRHICEKDSGIYDGMNKGVNLSKGRYINLLNADDYYYNNDVLGYIYDEIENTKKNNPLEIILGNMRLSTPNIELIPKMDKWRWHMGLNHPTWFVNRNVYEKLGNFNVTYLVSADFDFAQRCILANLKISVIQETLVCFSTEGISSTSYKGYLEDYRIRRKNQTVNHILNVILLSKYTLEYLIAKIKRWF